MYSLRQDLSHHTITFDLVTLTLKFDLLSKNFNLGHNFPIRRARDFILHLCIPCDKSFQIISGLTYFSRTLTLAITFKPDELGLSYCICAFLVTTLVFLSGCTITCSDEYKPLLSALSSNSAVCGTFGLSQTFLLKELLCIDEVTPQLMHSIQRDIPLLFKLLSEIKHVAKCLKPIIEEIIAIVETTFSAGPYKTELKTTENPLAFFPNLPKLGERGSYKMDQSKGEQLCTKKSGHHPSLLPGIFTVFCPHGIKK